ncbi:hypothetical protein IPC1132_11015 [Pseudomonas aeruginosa]|uniref:hypothetical protein n=1 Tax=Pseudomonas aeruginosa TaxID=287 RepID=UPI000FC3F5BE|nr:hypothetical protein [Pseudomonas aeruginosa]RUF31672.1 hypothetical protein IPC1132_11015 [Pseudomonas aeruginosa]
MREEFEAWHHAEFGHCVPEEEDPLAIGECVKRWRIWQASRAALRVELPEPYAFHQEVQTVFLDRVKEALQQAGIEVKENG